MVRGGIGLAAVLADAAAIVGTAIGIEAIYFHLVHGTAPPIGVNAQVGMLIALFVVVANIFRDEYAIENYLAFGHHPDRLASLWTIGFLAVLTLAFVTKTTADYSRILVAVLYGAGLRALLLARYAVVALARRSSAVEATAVRRIYLVGYEEDLATFEPREAGVGLGCRVIGATMLRHPVLSGQHPMSHERRHLFGNENGNGRPCGFGGACQGGATPPTIRAKPRAGATGAVSQASPR